MIRPRITPIRVLAPLMVLLFVFVCVCAPSASAKSSADPVLKVISVALAKQQITPAQAREYRITWAISAYGARRASTSGRRREIVAVRAYTTSLAKRRMLTAPRLAPTMLSVRATNYVMRSSMRFPAHEAEVLIPGEPVVFTYYSGRGVQFQPFESFKEGMRQLNQVNPQVDAARAIADRMRELSVWHGDALVWEYYFPFGGPSTPWTSSISQALGVEFFHRLGKAVPAGEGTPYADTAAAMTQSFLRSTRAGGVFTPQGAGRWYLLYPFNPGQRILNGHLQVLVNLGRYYADTQSPQAKVVVDQGVVAVTPLLSQFDTGAWSNYQLGQEAELGYHEFQTSQLVKLGEELANPTFLEYGSKFQAYLETPPLTTVPATMWPAIIPAQDGYRDDVVLRYRVDKRSRDTLRIYGPTDIEIRAISISGGRGTHVIRWDGRARGTLQPDGEYRATITSVDVAGNAATVDVPEPLVISRDVEAPTYSRLILKERGAFTVVVVRAGDLGSAYVNASVRIGRTTIGSRRGPRMGQITLLLPRTIDQVRAGSLVLTDASGNSLVVPLGASAT